MFLSGEAPGTARPHSFTAQNGLDGEQLQLPPRGDTTERHNGRHNRKMMQNEKKLNSDHYKADEIGLVGV